MIAASRARLPLLSPLLRGIRHGSNFPSEQHRPPSIRRFVPDSLAASADVPLAKELFPERQKNGVDKEPLRDSVDDKNTLLPLPSLAELLADQKWASKSGIQTEAAAKDAARQEKCAVLLLQSASTTLVESDFRLLCPKSKHIEGWTGLGDIEKVIPGRDPLTLERSPYYFLLFRNPAHALAYQANAVRIYRHARAHTPSSIFSAPPPFPGAKVPREFRHAVPVSRPPPFAAGVPDPDAAEPPQVTETPSAKTLKEEDEEIEDAYNLIQDFALCAPAQRLNLTYIRPPFSPALLRLIARGGYLGDRAGRSVLLSIATGPRARLSEVRAAIAQNSADGDTARVEEVSQVNAIKGADNSKDRNPEGPSPPHPEPSSTTDTSSKTESLHDKFVVTFPDETAAQRFYRAWNQRCVDFSSAAAAGSANGGEEGELEESAARIRIEVLW